MLIFNTNLCYLCSQLLVSHRSISFFLFPIIRIHFPLCNRFLPVYSFFPFCFEKFNKLQLKFTNWIYLFFSYCTFETYIIQWGIKIADCYCSLVTFCEVFFINKVHRKPKNLVARSWDCMIFMHRKGDCCKRSKPKTQITKRHSAKYTAKYNVQITQIFF